MSSAVSDGGRAPIVVPDLQAEGPIRVVQWLVDSGTQVYAGDRVVELLASGIVFHVESPTEGIVGEIVRAGRAEVGVGEVLGWVDLAGDD